MEEILERWIKLLETNGINSKKIVRDEMEKLLKKLKEEQHVSTNISIKKSTI